MQIDKALEVAEAPSKSLVDMHATDLIDLRRALAVLAHEVRRQDAVTSKLLPEQIKNTDTFES